LLFLTNSPADEGKITTKIGLSGIWRPFEKIVIRCSRQPSQGPIFRGILSLYSFTKKKQTFFWFDQTSEAVLTLVVILKLLRWMNFNLHLTGDISAITAVNNLLANQIDARMFHENTQTDAQLFNRLVPNANGKRTFWDIQIKRLKTLNIDKIDLSALAEEEITAFVPLNIDPATISWQRVVDTNGERIKERRQNKQFDSNIREDFLRRSWLLLLCH
jgi:formyltetrahydrofolate synthetase